MRTRVDPKLRLHKTSGQSVVTLTDGIGGRRDVYLGPHDSPEAQNNYNRIIAEWKARGRALEATKAQAGLSINELVVAFMKYAKGYYKGPDGKPAQEVDNFRLSLRPLVHLYGSFPAGEFGPLKLKSVRELMVEGYEHPKYGPQLALARTNINLRIARIKMLFRWASEDELIPQGLYHELCSVKGLRHGRSEARETQPVGPVPVAFVEKTIEHAHPVVADMIRLQLLTGMRSGELVIMRPCDLDTSGPVWIYKPARHKNLYRGHARVVALGPQAQLIVRRHLQTNIEAPIFSPAEQRKLILADMRAKRKSKVQPSQQDRRKATPKKKPGDRFTTQSYYRCVREAAQRAGVPAWFPHQLRHTCATELRRKFGIDAARAILGHRTTAITETYAELDQGQAMEIMAKIG